MKKIISLIIFSLLVYGLHAQTSPTVPSSMTIQCGDLTTITATGSSGHYIWFGDSLQDQVIGTLPTINLLSTDDTIIYVGGLYPGSVEIESFNFTNCSVSGRTGPTQTDVNTEYTYTNLNKNVTIISQGIQQWIVPKSGYYHFEVAGAKGSQANGGLGAILEGDAFLNAGDTLQIIVGQEGLDFGTEYASGGGGSFVAIGGSHATAAPFIIAGGGGGVQQSHTQTPESFGSTSTSGFNGYDGTSGGTNGNGGSEALGNNAPGAGGGGFYTDGGSVTGTRAVEGGFAFQNGGNGGRGETNMGSGITGRPDGAFGCAGGSANSSGGGGGYSGGGSTTADGSSNRATGGGGSYIDPSFVNVSTSDGYYDSLANFNGTAIVDLASYNFGNGYVNINLLDTVVSTLASVNITVIPLDTPNVSAPSNVCYGDSVTFTASGSSGEYYWYADSLKTILIDSGTSITIPALYNDTVLYVETVSDTTIPVRNFTNCGVTGNTGPEQLDANTEYTSTSLDGEVIISTQGIQKWVVPMTAIYLIEAAGAQGGHSNATSYYGGLGAQNSGEFTLIQGDTLYILVGQYGESSNRTGGGGGGGGGASFIVAEGNYPLLVAAGGGGADWKNNGRDAGSLLTMTSNAGSSSSGMNAGANGAGYYQNAGGTQQYGGSSGGWLYWIEAGGKSYINGGIGGSVEPTLPNDQNYPRQGVGGFGCGGAGSNVAGGGGGGFAGGNGAATSDSTSYGGISFNLGFNQNIIAGANSGNGYVTINTVGPVCVSPLVEVEVFIDQTPIVTTQPTNVSITGGNNANFTVSASGGGMSYQWQISTDSGTVWSNLTETAPYSGVTTTTLTVSGVISSQDQDHYRCLVSNSCGTDTSDAGILTITNVGIDDYTINSTRIYPNPVSDNLLIEIDNRESNHIQISVYDLIGKLIIEFPEEELQQGINNLQYNMESLADGVYYLEVRIDMIRKLHKLIKE